jgi:hypothetical protein
MFARSSPGVAVRRDPRTIREPIGAPALPFRVSSGALARVSSSMREGDARRLLDATVARTHAERTAWVRQFVRAGRDLGCAVESGYRVPVDVPDLMTRAPAAV